MLVRQFKSLIVALLLVATVVAFALGENIEAVAILVVIVLNAVDRLPDRVEGGDRR